MSNYKFTYLNYDGIDRYMAIATLDTVWRTMHEQNLFTTVFYDGFVNTLDDMESIILRPGCVPVVVHSGDDLAAMTWLNGFDGKVARGHFVIFRKFWGRARSVPLGHAMFSYLLGLKDKYGYLWDTLVGITPESNVMAWRRAIDCGAEYVGAIPHCCPMADGTVQKGVIVAVTRESLLHKEPRAGADTI